MTKFLAIFFTLYTAMHAVFYMQVRALLPERRSFHVLFILFLLLMIVAPIISRLLERNGYESAAKYLAVIAFNWTGFIFLAFCGALVMLIIDGCFWALNYFGSANLPLLTGKFPALFLIGIVLSLCFYGYREARAIKIERIRIETTKLPVGTDRLKIIQNGLFTLLLKHRPWVSNNSLGRFDLQLSGHTHGGQIYPFNYLVSLQYPLPVGMVALPKESFLYTNRGSGTWGPQIRLLSPPEVTAIELVRKTLIERKQNGEPY